MERSRERGRRPPPRQEPQRDAITNALCDLVCAVKALGERIASLERGHRGLGVHVVIHKEVPMPPIAVPPLKDTEKILLSVMPRKADGSIDIAAVITWVSSDPTKVGVETGTEPFDYDDGLGGGPVTCPGFFNCWATTPLSEAASATVTVSAPGYASDTFEISYAPGVPRSLNASFGQPVSDL